MSMRPPAERARRDGRLPVVFLYPGQGAHYPAMGRALFDDEPAFRDTLFRADRLLRRLTGAELVETLFGSDDAWLEDLAFSHPAIVAVEWAITRALGERGVMPDAVLGASLGEYVALVAAGCIGFDEMFALVVEQARVVCDRVPRGGMLAVIGDERWQHRRGDLLAGLEIAARNFDGHLVLAGDPGLLDQRQRSFEAEGLLCSRLPVRFAFHSDAVAPAREAFAARCAGVRLAPPRIPLFSCACGGRLDVADGTHLWRIVREPIRFADTVRALEAEGPQHYVDAGPSGTLATFVTHLLGAGARTRVSVPLSPGGGNLPGIAAALTVDAA